MLEAVKSGPFIGTDDTRVAMLKPGHGKTATARYWPYLGYNQRGSPTYVVWDFTATREAEGPLQFLGDYRGGVQVDGTSVYNPLFLQCGEVTGRALRERLGCWGHFRRKVVEGQTSEPEYAARLVHLIGRLYEIEAEMREATPEERRARRVAEAWPIIHEQIGPMIRQASKEVLPESPLGKAFGYWRRQRKTLLAYLRDGRVPTDHNWVENKVRPLAVGRKNWLFVGNEVGGKTAMVLMSVVHSCWLHGVDVRTYLIDVLERIQDHPVNRLSELLPDRCKALCEPPDDNGGQ